MRASSKSALSYASIVLGVGLTAIVSSPQIACSGSGNPSSASDPAADVGVVGMKLTFPGGETLSTATWSITGPNGASTVVQSGTLNLQNSQVLSFSVGGIPAGSGYTVTVTATSTDGAVTCAGSASFAVTAHATTNVTLLLQCAAGAPDAGSVAINGMPYFCAAASGASATPSETAIGTSVGLTGSGVGPNGAAITYAWSAPSGTFSSPTGQSTNFTCTQQGPVTVTLSVSDGALPDGSTCNPSLSSTTVTVQCDSPVDAGASDATVSDSATPDSGASACNLGANGAIKHVIYVQFDNTHLYRDNPNVPSDLEQMPHLLNFIRSNGTVMANDHTILISHTAGGILSSLTGVYPDRNGQTVTNSYVRTSSAGKFTFPSSFQYWTDSVSGTGLPTSPNLVTPSGAQMPAPWVPYTRAGCNFGAVAAADMVLENTTSDVATTFGSADAGAKTVTNIEGIAIHCAQGSSVCASGVPDQLPNEPGGYTGFNALFGAGEIDPYLTGQPLSVPLTDLLGQPIQDSSGNPGFPGFNGMTPAVSLAYMAYMQEHGVPITFAYISDAHDSHGVDGSGQSAFGPGETGYVQQLQAYDTAFQNFFTRLASDGITQANTLFVFTVDEGDHFVGATPTPAGCDGVTTPCNYSGDAGQRLVGEINLNIDTTFSTEQPSLASQYKQDDNANPSASLDFTVHGDDAPTFYLSRIAGDGGALGPLGQTDPSTRAFERAAATLTATNPYNGNTDSLLFRMADQAALQAVHMMTTGDTSRNPTFAYFADDDYFISDFGISAAQHDTIQSSFAWNHGDDQAPIGNTWIGFVGPGVTTETNNQDSQVWTDHTDVRATMLSVLGLHDTYAPLDGRVITQVLQSSAYSPALQSSVMTAEALGDAYKQINAPFNVFPQCILSVGTYALQADDSTYTSLESQITSLTSQRDSLATSIKNALDAAEFGTTPVDAGQASTWESQATTLVNGCNSLLLSVSDGGGAPGH
jgi:hypothetical protein